MNSLFNENTICLDLLAVDKKSVLDELAGLLAADGILNNLSEYRTALDEREKLSSTAIGFSIAIPHAKCPAVKEPRVAVGFSKKGIKYDNETVKLVFMIAVGESDNDLHLKTLANLSRRLISSEFRDKLLAAGSKCEVVELLDNI